MNNRLKLAGWLFVGGLAADQLSKALALRFLSGPGTIRVIGDFFRLDLAYNPGFSFSLGMGLPIWVRLGLQVVVPLIVISYTALRIIKEKAPFWESLALASLSAGALGNLTDRLFRGFAVVDFLSFRMYGLLGFQYWPTFNVADTMIVVGALGFAFTQLTGDSGSRHKVPAGQLGQESESDGDVPKGDIEPGVETGRDN